MATEWATTKVESIQAGTKGAIAIGPFGSRMKSDCYVESGVPVIRGTNITGGPSFEGDFVFISDEMADSLGPCNVYKGDLVFPHRGAIGEVGIVSTDSRYVISSSLMKLTCDLDLANPWYVYYFFKSHLGKHELLKNASQVGTPGIGQPLTSLKAIDIPLPPLPDQKAIAHILGSLDDKIELNRQMNATLEAMAQALFKSWFVDFDPVIDNALAAGNPIPEPLQKRAEAKGALTPGPSPRGRGENGSPLPLGEGLGEGQLPEAIQKQFPNRFVFNEEMGWVPEGWEARAVEEAIEINPRVPLKKGTVAPFVDMKALPTSGFDIADVIQKAYSGGAKFQRGDVLFARITPCLENGKTGIVDFLQDDEFGFGSTEFVVLRGKGSLRTAFVACLSRHAAFRSHCELGMVGSSGRQRVQNSSFGDFFLALPTHPGIADEFDRAASMYFAKMAASKNEAMSLAALRDIILPKLLSGQLRIPDAEKQLAEAL